MTTIAAVLVSRADFDCVEGLEKPWIASVSSPREFSDARKVARKPTLLDLEALQSDSKAKLHVLSPVSEVHSCS